MNPDTPSYWRYLRLDQLLDLQAGLGEREADVAPDELHFIVVHQVFELWFKLVLNELRLAHGHLAAEPVPEAEIPHVVHHLARVNEILRLAVEHFRVVETLSPQDFLAFRDRLFGASGFQSVQMREIELILGLDEVERMRALMGITAESPLDALEREAARRPEGAWVAERLRAARTGPTLRGALEKWLYRTPIDGSLPGDAGDAAAVKGFATAYVAASREHLAAQTERLKAISGADGAELGRRLEAGVASVQAFLLAEDASAAERTRVRRVRCALVFIESHRTLPLLAWPRLLLDRVVELEELLLLWRTRHVRMVERVIGRRTGTGGSPGVEYLERTTGYRIFKDLWQVRTVLLPASAVPPLRNARFYDFVSPT